MEVKKKKKKVTQYPKKSTNHGKKTDVLGAEGKQVWIEYRNEREVQTVFKDEN